MYRYEWDAESNGPLLLDSPSKFSMEPRPVWPQELIKLGLGDRWDLGPSSDVPVMWAEAARYIYRGSKVIRLKGGDVFTAPEVTILKDAPEEGSKLVSASIPLIVKRSSDLLTTLENRTISRLQEYQDRMRPKLDCFHVAFSGGKDSMVLLDLVARAWSHDSFCVIFSDTGMEFPDTYALIDEVERWCASEGIAFERAKSPHTPDETWKMFGPPSNRIRWCCSVHKSAPQIIKAREMVGRSDYIGTDIVGVRADESLRRSTYEFECYSKKQKGQYSFNTILDWSSAEIWLYILSHHLSINEAYKKGNSRAGCLFCPLGGGGKSDWFRMQSYPDEVSHYHDLIRNNIDDSKSMRTYISNGGWVNRLNGRDIKGNAPNYFEVIIGDELRISIPLPKSPWSEWRKTIRELPGPLSITTSPDGGMIFTLPKSFYRKHIMRPLRRVLHKVASCGSCGVYEGNCPHGHLHFSKDGTLSIDDECIQCGQCHEVDDGCLLFHSIRLTKKNVEALMRDLPTSDEMRYFLSSKTLPDDDAAFKLLCVSCGLWSNSGPTRLCNLLSRLTWDFKLAQGIMLIQLIYAYKDVRWLLENVPLDTSASLTDIATWASESNRPDVAESPEIMLNLLSSLCSMLPLLDLGTVEDDMVTLHATQDVDDGIVLWALHRFMEESHNQTSFSLNRLMTSTPYTCGLNDLLRVQSFAAMRVKLKSSVRRYNDLLSFSNDSLTFAPGKTQCDIIDAIYNHGEVTSHRQEKECGQVW